MDRKKNIFGDTMLPNMPRYRLRQTAFWVFQYEASSLPSGATVGIYEPESSLTRHITLLPNLWKVDFLKQMSFAPVDGERAIVPGYGESVSSILTGCVLGNAALSGG